VYFVQFGYGSSPTVIRKLSVSLLLRFSCAASSLGEFCGKTLDEAAGALIATPIGSSAGYMRPLASADLIAAEDTTRTARKLMEIHGVPWDPSGCGLS
jgi:hypothetical protein